MDMLTLTLEMFLIKLNSAEKAIIDFFETSYWTGCRIQQCHTISVITLIVGLFVKRYALDVHIANQHQVLKQPFICDFSLQSNPEPKCSSQTQNTEDGRRPWQWTVNWQVDVCIIWKRENYHSRDDSNHTEFCEKRGVKDELNNDKQKCLKGGNFKDLIAI